MTAVASAPPAPSETSTRSPTFADHVAQELDFARHQYGALQDAEEALGVIAEEVDEYRRQVPLTPSFRRPNNLLKEVVQVAAMCQRFAEDLRLSTSERFSEWAAEALRLDRMQRGPAPSSHAALVRIELALELVRRGVAEIWDLTARLVFVAILATLYAHCRRAAEDLHYLRSPENHAETT